MALTAKQQAFAEYVAKGKSSLSDCYRKAYNAEKMSPAAVRVEASKLMARPDVTLIVERLKAAKERAVVAAAVSDADFVMTKLREMADSAQPGDSVKLRAVELLGKTCGLFRDVVETQTQRAPDEVKAELEELLAKVAERANTDKSEPADNVPTDERVAAEDDPDMNEHPVMH